MIEKVSSPVQDENSNKLANTIKKPLLVVSPSATTVPPSPRPKTATSKIFAPRTEEMSKGFLTFSEEEPGLTSKYLFSYVMDAQKMLSILSRCCVVCENSSTLFQDFGFIMVKFHYRYKPSYEVYCSYKVIAIMKIMIYRLIS